MQRISSRLTTLNKWLPPLIVFGFLSAFVGVVLISQKDQNPPPLFVLMLPILLGGVMFFVFRRLIWDLADEVTDLGDALQVRIGSEEDRIPLSNIINVSYSYMMNPQRVTLTLRAPSRFGQEISFSPPASLVPLRRNPAILELIQRVDGARQAAR